MYPIAALNERSAGRNFSVQIISAPQCEPVQIPDETGQSRSPLGREDVVVPNHHPCRAPPPALPAQVYLQVRPYSMQIGALVEVALAAARKYRQE